MKGYIGLVTLAPLGWRRQRHRSAGGVPTPRYLPMLHESDGWRVGGRCGMTL